MSDALAGALRWSREQWASEERLPRAPVCVRWLGTAGFAIEHAGTTVLIDPYVTRAGFFDLAKGPLRPDIAAAALYAPKADAIVLGHTHFDHAMDAPAIARRTGATVFGSRSAHLLCRSEVLPDAQLDDVESALKNGEVVREVGPFTLRFIPSVHSPFALGHVPFAGEIQDCDQVPLRFNEYKCGAVFTLQLEVAGLKIVHLGSANLLEGQIKPREVDLLLLCVAGWTATKNFPARAMRTYSPKRVLLSHWDNFFSPMKSALKSLPAMRMGKLVDGLHEQSRTLPIGTLGLLGEVIL